MGTWGTEIFENDTFLDVKDYYSDLLDSGKRRGAAEKETIQEFSELLDDPDDAPFVYFAIADAQMEDGKISATARKNALKAIKMQKTNLLSSGEMQDFAEAQLKGLEEFKTRIETCPAAVKRLPPVKCEWQMNDVYAMQFQGEAAKQAGIYGRFLLVRVVSLIQEGRDTLPFVYMSISDTCELPQTREDVANASYIQADTQRQFRYVLRALESSEYDRFTFIGNFPDMEPPENEFILPEKAIPLFHCSILVKCVDNWMTSRYVWFSSHIDIPTCHDTSKCNECKNGQRS